MKVNFNSLIATIIIPVSAIFAQPAYSQSKVMIHHEIAMGTEFQMYLLSKEPVFQGDGATTYLVKLESTTMHGYRDVEPALVVCSNQLGPQIVSVDNYDGNYKVRLV